MANALVCFSHGQEGTPWGRKIRKLADVAYRYGCRVESPDYTKIADPDERARLLVQFLAQLSAQQQPPEPLMQQQPSEPLMQQQPPEPLILVGSSMGAYASIVASTALRPCGLFLLAPAVYLPEYADQDPIPHHCPTVIVHGWQDTVVPVDSAIRFAQQHRLLLHLVDDDHRLLKVMPFLEVAFSWFLEQTQASSRLTIGSGSEQNGKKNNQKQQKGNNPH